MKLGVLTFHRTINEGSILQAYCLQRLIQSSLPESHVEIIDYQRLDVFLRELKKIILKRPPFVNLHQLGKYLALHFFRVRHLKTSGKLCLTNNFLKARNFIQSQKYSAIFVGSDTVWRIRNINTDLPSQNIFYLPGLQDFCKISFAASMDKSQSEFIESLSLKRMVYNLLSEFQFITVRDKTTQDYLIDAGVPEKKISEMPDPTLLWDFSSVVEDASKLESSSKMVGLSVSSSSAKMLLTQHYIKQGFRVLNMLGPSERGQDSIPFWYNYQKRMGTYRKIDFLITDRFHGSIIALRIGRIPVVFLEDMQEYPDSSGSKGSDLLQKLKIPWTVHRFDSHRFGSKDIERIEAILKQWSQLNPDVAIELDRLRAEAEPAIKRLFDSLQRISNTV